MSNEICAQLYGDDLLIRVPLDKLRAIAEASNEMEYVVEGDRLQRHVTDPVAFGHSVASALNDSVDGPNLLMQCFNSAFAAVIEDRREGVA